MNEWLDRTWRPHATSLALCPICFDSSGALTDGARAGGLVLAVIAAVVLASCARFAWRLR